MSEKPETLPLFEQFLRGGELLRPAVSYSGYYVSNYGRIFSLGHHHRGPQELKIRVNRHGYRCAWLYLGSQKYKAIKVARLVADAFLQPSDKKFVLHNDGIRTHDVASNLRWGTHQENMADMVGHEKSRKGERHPSDQAKSGRRETHS